MNNEVFKLLGTIGVDTKDADESINSTTKNAKEKSEKISGYFKTAAKVIGSVFAISKIIDFGKASVEAAAAAQAIQSQFDQVFADLGPSANTALNGMADTFGMLPNRLKGAFTTTTSMFKGLGLDTEAAMGQATKAVTLAADAAAFYDKSYEDANSALNSFIKGNYEGGEQIGLFANDTQLAIWAGKNLGVEWKKLGEADKQMARLKFAQSMQEAAGATGQAARESDTYANQVGNMQQAWTDFKVFVGKPIMGVAIQGLKFVTKALQDAVPFIQEMGRRMTEMWNGVTSLFNGNGDISQSFIRIFDMIKTVAVPIFENAMIFVKDIIAQVKAFWDEYGAQFVTAVQNAFQFIADIVAFFMPYVQNTIGTVFEYIKAIFQGALDVIMGAVKMFIGLFTGDWDTFWNGIKQVFGGIWKAISGTFGSVIQGMLTSVKITFGKIGEALMGPIEKAKNFIKEMIDKIKSFFDFKWELPKIKMPHVKIDGEFSLLPPKVPKFSIDWYKDGGIMTSPTLFGMNGMRGMVGGEAGDEAILPLNRETLGMIGDGIFDASGQGGGGWLQDKLDTIIELLTWLFQKDPQSFQLLLESGAIAGELMPYIDKEMGKQTERKKRGG